MDTAYRGALRHVGQLKWVVLAFWLAVFAGKAAGWWRLPGGWFGALVACFVFATGASAWARWQRDRWIREAPLPQFLKRKLRQAYPQLEQKDADLVERGLRQFFMACNRSQGQFVAMPSRAVDAMWHEFILHTQAYRDWCALALGRFLHHTPAEALGGAAKRNDGLRRAWFWACKDEAINPRKPTRLPLLFALDGKLEIPHGFRYVPDCNDIDRKSADGGGDGGAYCGTSFADGSAGGDADGFGGVDNSNGGDGGDGGGDGGGCGGGGD
ncbi:hypothetical protein [Ramlibacter sp.]|uniref:glycine-rich domain-containing protein n=1 Tax=Ramlibacter sp. TaxID=1917967 RepID=UPI0017C35292|nr:hypothetical protein [Ramlibacter sp.]MBA2674856.1 hypothetical protein [Ramlibacter sp.]